MRRQDHHQQQHHHKKMAQDFKRRFFISLLFTLPILFLSPLIQGWLGFEFSFSGSEYVIFGFASLIFVYGGWPFLKGFKKELSGRKPGMMTLIALAISVAYIYSAAVVFGLRGKFFFWELATLIDVMLLGHWIEMRSVLSASKALESLAELIPAEAHLIKEDGVEEVAVSELTKGDEVLIKPGEKVPADGRIIKGKTSINEALLTGESKPVSKQVGDEVIGGSINQEGAIQAEITGTGQDSYISQVIDLVKEAQESKSKAQSLADRAALWLTIIAITVGLITLIAWLAFGRGLNFAIGRMVTVMVITCPHALGLAIPLVASVSTSISAQNGYLIRNRTAFEKARNTRAVIFDKTGTLTEGKFGVSQIVALDNYECQEVLKIAASIEQNSEHSIAESIVERARQLDLALSEVDEFENLPGKGVEGKIRNQEVMVVGKNYLEEEKMSIESETIKELERRGQTASYVLVDGKIIGAIFLSDLIREESQSAIDTLESKNIKRFMLTGDSEEVAREVASQLGLDDYFAEVLPDQKASVVKEIQEKFSTVMMVGDGVNDAPALVQADLGVAIGAGTDVAVETADVVLARNDPRDIPSIIEISKATYTKIKQNLGWATGYNVIAIPLAAGVLYKYGILLSPAIGAILMSLSTVIVAVNAKFLSID